jgi:hypothetical protein
MTNAELRHTAQHEALHGLLGLEAGGMIDEVSIEEAFTITRFPFAPWQLGQHFAYLPAYITAQTRKIIAAIIAPSALQSEALAGGDLDLAQRWQEAWDRLPEACSWRTLRADALLEALAWRREHREVVEWVATALMARKRVVGHAAWVQLVQDCCTPQVPRRTAPTRPAAIQQRALTNSIRVEHLTCFPDWRTSGHAGTALLHLSL